MLIPSKKPNHMIKFMFVVTTVIGMAIGIIGAYVLVHFVSKFW